MTSDDDDQARASTPSAFADLYAGLRQLARARLRREPPGTSLQATELVHEAFLRLQKSPDAEWQSRGHFFAAAAETMRRILVDRARAKMRLKRGGVVGRRAEAVTLGDDLMLDLAVDYDPVQILAVERAIQRLEEADPRAANVVVLRFFGGLDVRETAEALETSERSVQRDWTFGKAWLFDALKQLPGE